MTTTLPVRIVPSLQERLRQAVAGEVRFDLGSRATYSVDSSNYREVPVAVVAPRSVDDAVTTITVCAREGAPVVSRGGRTSLGGQTTNSAVVLDWTKSATTWSLSTSSGAPAWSSRGSPSTS